MLTKRPDPEPDPEPATLSRAQCAAFLGVSVTTVDRMIKSRELKAVHLRTTVRITRRDAEAALNGPMRRPVGKRAARIAAARAEFDGIDS